MKHLYELTINNSSFFTIGIVCIVVLYCILKYFNRSKLFSKKTKPNYPQKRAQDTRKLSSFEKSIIKQAKLSTSNGNILEAAKLLESIFLHREAIDLLEKHGFIKEASDTLVRIGAIDRAGFICAKYGLYDRAISFYQRTHNQEALATCFYLNKNYQQALEIFLTLSDYEKIAICYENLEDYSNAAKYYIKLNNQDKAISLYKKLVEKSENISDIHLDPNEISIIEDYLVNTEPNIELADLVANSSNLSRVVISYVIKKELDTAVKLSLRSISNIGPDILEQAKKHNLSKEFYMDLVKVFIESGNDIYAAKVYEDLSMFKEAGDIYSRKEDLDNARSCYEKAGIVIEDTYNKDNEDNIIYDDNDYLKQNIESSKSYSSLSLDNNSSNNTFNEDNEKTQQLELYSDKSVFNPKDFNFFETLDKEEIGSIIPLLIKEEMNESSCLIEKGSIPRGVFFIVEGSILKDGVSCSEKELGLEDILLDTISEYEYTAESHGYYYFIPQESLLNYIESNSKLTQKLYKSFYKKVV